MTDNQRSKRPRFIGRRWSSIRIRMLVWFGSISIGIVLVMCWVWLFGIPLTAYVGAYRGAMSEVLRHLELVADLRKDRLQLWLEECNEDAQFLASSKPVSASLARLEELIPETSSVQQVQEALRNDPSVETPYNDLLVQFLSFIKIHEIYSKIVAVSAQSGMVLASTNDKDLGHDVSERPYFSALFRSGYRETVQVEREKDSGEPYLVISHVVTSHLQDHGHETIGVIALFIEMDKVVRPILYSGGKRSASDDILLVNSDVKILLPLRFPLPDGTQAKPLEYAVDSVPARLAAQGKEGATIRNDYRDVSVLAVYRYIRISSEQGWGLVVKRDLTEVHEPVWRNLSVAAGTGLAGILAAIILLGYAAQNISKPIEDLSRAAERVRGGDFEVRITPTGTRESAILGSTFNSMVDRLRDWHEKLATQVQARTAELVEANTQLAREIEERKTAQDALSKSEALLDNIMQQSPFSMWVSDATGTLQRINPACKKWTRLTDEEVVGKYNVLLDEAVEKQGLMPLVRSVFEEGRAVNFELAWDSTLVKHIDHSLTTRLILDVTIFPVKNADGEITNAVCQHIDVTDRKMAEEALRESEHDLRLAQGIARVGSWVWKLNSDEVACSEEMLRILGYQPDQGSLTLQEVLVRIHPGDRDRVKEALDACVKHSDAYEAEFRLVLPDGTERVIYGMGHIAPGNHGKSPEVHGTGQDITERKRAEEQIRNLNEELEKRVRDRTAELEIANKDLEAFAYTVSHDLRAPLRAIAGFSQIVARRHRASLNEEGQRYVDNVVKASGQMDRLINDLLNYSRLGRKAVKWETVSFKDVLTTVIENLSDRITQAGAQVIFPDEIPAIKGDWTLLNQILTNLIDNAITYRREGVPPKIEVNVSTETNCIILAVKDNGLGIAPEYHQKIFSIFQRLHSQERYPGTGIGLAVVSKSAQMLGGNVWVESSVDQGSAFFVRLPIAPRLNQS